VTGGRLAALSRTGTEVVILGAGINGAGLFRDLCEHGVLCLIVDKADFGSGTSAAPSRLIHGGLKYLETGEFGLVAQSTLERNLLLKNAPHCVEPLPTLIPIFSWTRGIGSALRTLMGSTTAPRSRGAVLIKAGLAIYDFYGAKARVMPRHRLLGRRRALRETPPLTPEIVAAGLYYDAKISRPERLVYELIRDGLDANPHAAAASYTTLTGTTDGELAFRSADGTGFKIRPQVVVNAAGPWIDRVNATLGAPSHLIGGRRCYHRRFQRHRTRKSNGAQHGHEVGLVGKTRPAALRRGRGYVSRFEHQQLLGRNFENDRRRSASDY
jgi:glycerol-3-phosphate dehydrogenase